MGGCKRDTWPRKQGSYGSLFQVKMSNLLLVWHALSIGIAWHACGRVVEWAAAPPRSIAALPGSPDRALRERASLPPVLWAAGKPACGAWRGGRQYVAELPVPRPALCAGGWHAAGAMRESACKRRGVCPVRRRRAAAVAPPAAACRCGGHPQRRDSDGRGAPDHWSQECHCAGRQRPGGLQHGGCAGGRGAVGNPLAGQPGGRRRGLPCGGGAPPGAGCCQAAAVRRG